MVVSRLVMVRRYPYRETAQGDHRLLLDAGIESHLKWTDHEDGDHHRMLLMVPAEQLGRAREVLKASPHLFDSADSALLPPCPHCRSRDADPRPPYALMILAVGAAVGIGIAARGEVAPALGVMTAGGIASAIAYARAARWRCRKCGRLYAGAGR